MKLKEFLKLRTTPKSQRLTYRQGGEVKTWVDSFWKHKASQELHTLDSSRDRFMAIKFKDIISLENL